MLSSEMFGVERDVDFKVKGYESLFKVMQGAGGGGMSDFHRYPIEDVVSDIHNSKPFEERKEICIHANASQVNAFEHAKHIIRKHEKAMLRELTEWQNRIVAQLEKDVAERMEKQP